MSAVTEAAARAKEHLEKQNPTAAPGKTRSERKRIPLSVPQRKLEVPTIPGYHLRWIRGTAQRLLQAERAGFTYVDAAEVDLNSNLLGGDASHSGNTDMGSRVSLAEGGEVENGQAVRLYLMKQPMEFYLEDSKIVQDRNDEVASALTSAFKAGQVGGRAEGEKPEDAGLRYVAKSRTRIPELFRKKG